MVEKLFSELSSLEQIEAIALGGSRAGDKFDEKSDYDVYVYCNELIDDEVRFNILNKYCSVMEIGNHFWEYEDNCTLNNGVDIDIIYRNLDDFLSGVANVVEKCMPYNGYTTCMWHNLINNKIVFDKDGRLLDAQNRFNVEYPELLRKNIINNNMRLLTDNLPSYDKQISKAVQRGDIVSVNHRVAAFVESYFDIIFAMNKVTHPGEKRLITLTKERCNQLPKDFEENLVKLFEDMYSNSRNVCEDIKIIINNLKEVLGY